tara:strand:+ start:714 stop:1046 length:333 start_codon:yes stop_codon:yes gene_type:complete
MLGHTLVPHHHAEEHGHGHDHHHTHHHENKGIKDLFSHHCHSVDCFTSVEKFEVHSTIEKPSPTAIEVQSSGTALRTYYRPVLKTYKFTYIYISPHLVHLDFRGPPALSV